MQDSEPISICMNNKFSTDGYRAFVLQELSIYKNPIHASDYQNYIDESNLYTSCANIEEGMLYELKKRGDLEILICICLYNEQSDALKLTLNGIYQNLPYLAEEGVKEHQIAVVLVQDGILKCDQSVLDFYQQFDEKNGKCMLKERVEIIKQEIENAKRLGKEKKVYENDNFPETIPKKIALLYQNTWKPDPSDIVTADMRSRYSLNILSCFKHLNGKKLSSHAWFFQGFCRYLKPRYCILLDVGTVPDKKGVVNLYKGMLYDPRIGGVSGFMGIDSTFESYEGGLSKKAETRMDKGQPLNVPSQFTYQEPTRPTWLTEATQLISENKKEKSFFESIAEWIGDSLWSVEKAQEVEYIYAHFLDKNTESFTGFLHVLPGAWSGYQLKALQTGEMFDKDILQEKYFRTILNPTTEEGEGAYKFANMYLAEDRILSLGIYCQRQKNFYLKYIPNAGAKTDPMKSHYDLITQRRRWINSSMFAFEYVNANYQFDFEQSSHSRGEWLLMMLCMWISKCSNFNAYFIPCFYLFVLYSTIKNNGIIQDPAICGYVALGVSFLYLGVLVACICGSLNGNIWIKQIYEVDNDGVPKLDSSGQFTKLEKPKNGPALYVSISMGFFTYLLFFTVTSMIAKILYNGYISFFVEHKKPQLVSMMVFALLMLNMLIWILTILMHICTHPKEVWMYIRGYWSYLAYQGVYTHTMTVFSFCNVDDVSWGTKGADAGGQKKYQREKMTFVSMWIFWNTLLCFMLFFVDFVIPGNQKTTNRQYILIGLTIYSTILHTLKGVFAFVNHIKFYLFECCPSKPEQPSQNDKQPEDIGRTLIATQKSLLL